jgi:hypothetical protein
VAVGFALSLPAWLFLSWAILFISSSWEYNGPDPQRDWLALVVFSYPMWAGALLALAAATRKRRAGVIPLAIATLLVAAMLLMGLSFLRYAFWPR